MKVSWAKFHLPHPPIYSSQNNEITFPSAFKLPTGKALIDFTCFSWKVAFARGLQPWQPSAVCPARSHGCAFLAASASKKQK